MRHVFLAALVALGAIDAWGAEPESGEYLYVRYCSSCHGTDAKGGTLLADLMKVPVPDLTRIAIRKDGWFPDVTVREIIDGRYAAHGRREMPVWGTVLSQAQIVAITEYLYSLQVDK